MNLEIDATVIYDGRQRRSADVRRHQQHELAVQHVQEPRAAAGSDRDAGEGLDPRGDEPCRRSVALLRRRRQDGNHAFATTLKEHEEHQDRRAERRPLSAAPTGSTRVAAVIGDPIALAVSGHLQRRSSPQGSTGCSSRSVAAGDAGAFDGVRAAGIGGLSVTMPHKGAVCARRRAHSRSRGPGGGQLRAEPRRHARRHNTDGDGASAAPWPPAALRRGDRFVVLGAGGATERDRSARARRGRVIVVNRSAERPRQRPRRAAPVLGRQPRRRREGVEIVGATSVGMGGDGLPSPSRCSAHHRS